MSARPASRRPDGAYGRRRAARPENDPPGPPPRGRPDPGKQGVEATTINSEPAKRGLAIPLVPDAIAAHDDAIGRLSDGALAGQVAASGEDHLHHLEVLRRTAAEAEAPAEGSAKGLPSTGKIAHALLARDGAIRQATMTDEDDTVTADGRASGHP